ncbi:unnamed protein product [Lactuca virosa]|uniref:Uncharacterized protein n=1 Tax=Lactuca virosa TaxID=75947 RepID=A0AAU9NAC8_9ASTR|nr:unnamed protein product [Lactuca virosa]
MELGFEVSLEDIENTVNVTLEEKKIGDPFAHVRKKQPWADPKIVKSLIDSKVYALLGEKTAADNEKPLKKKKEKHVKVETRCMVLVSIDLQMDIDMKVLGMKEEDKVVGGTLILRFCYRCLLVTSAERCGLILVFDVVYFSLNKGANDNDLSSASRG